MAPKGLQHGHRKVANEADMNGLKSVTIGMTAEMTVTSEMTVGHFVANIRTRH